jgi:hypothetical protein
VELLPASDPEVQALDREETAIRKAEAAYRADPALAADLEESGWFPERTQAATEGRAVRGEGRRQAAPVMPIVQPGQVAFKPSPWAGFVNLLADVNTRRVELLERRRPEIMTRLALAEAELRARVLQAKVRDVAGLVLEADELLRLATLARGRVPRTLRTAAGLAPAKYRARTDELELVDAALGSWSLLDPVPGDEPVSVIAGSYGIQRDDTPPADRRERQDQAVYGTRRG